MKIHGDEISGDQESGTIFVLRSHNDHPDIVKDRTLIHKIEFAEGDGEKFIAGAKRDTAYLLAHVEIVQTYKLAKVDSRQLKTLFHKMFRNTRVDIEIEDGRGDIVRPQDWFLVPLDVIDETVERIKDGSITNYHYGPSESRLVAR